LLHPVLGDFREIFVEEILQRGLSGFERTLGHHEAKDGAELTDPQLAERRIEADFHFRTILFPDEGLPASARFSALCHKGLLSCSDSSSRQVNDGIGPQLPSRVTYASPSHDELVREHRYGAGRPAQR